MPLLKLFQTVFKKSDLHGYSREVIDARQSDRLDRIKKLEQEAFEAKSGISKSRVNVTPEIFIYSLYIPEMKVNLARGITWEEYVSRGRPLEIDFIGSF